MKPISETDLEQLSAYIDGELSDSERRFFQKRLSSDTELRAACERAWIASSILKSQPIQLMPTSCAEAICAQCEDRIQTNVPWRLVASVAAVALAFGLGIQWLPSGQQPKAILAQTTTVSARQIPAPEASPKALQTETPLLATTPVKVVSVPAKPAASSLPIAQGTDNPSEFALNEAVLAKSWPQRDAAMQGYLIRHNQMAGNSAGNDLISYAELLAEPQPAADVPEQENK